MRRKVTSALVFALLSLSAPAFAATVSGTIRDTNAAGLAGMEVRLWSASTKGYEINTVVVTASDGTYSFSSVAAGTYKLDARMAPMVEGNYGDRWYDQAAPVADGYVFADADELVIADSDVLTGMNIELEQLGGLDVRVMAGSNPIQNLRVRAELKSDERVHHIDTTDGTCCGTNPHLGKSYFRGMVPGNYRFLVYDPAGVYAMAVLPGPFTVTAGSDADAGDVAITAMPNDPSEPNQTSTDNGTPTIASLPFVPQNTSISPSGDLDFYCINAMAGERYKASVTSMISVEGVERRHPWFDPMVGLWDGSAIVMSNDDVMPGQAFDAELDTGNLPSAGRWCFVVTTFGDTNFAGSGQLSTGEYQVDIGFGNRPPTFDVTYENAAVPVAPMEILVDEDVPLVFDLAFTDPDGDMLNIEVRHFDNASTPVVSGDLQLMANTGTYTWTPTQTDAALSPFELTFRAADSEFDLRIPVIVRVGAVSVPPTIPVLLTPEDASTVDTSDPTLVIENSTDADGDPITYDFQIEFGEPDGMPEDEVSGVAEDPSGMTSTTITGLEENALVSWRARAYDGADYSAWSDYFTFLVDAVNDPPDAPTIVKPEANTRIDERQPTIAATVPADPEGEAVTLMIELARDEDFEDVVATSGELTPDTDMTMVNWLTEDLLDWGAVYYTRANATDERGATSEWSDVVAFSIRFETDITAPSFSGTFATCQQQRLSKLPSEVVILSVDGSGDVVTFEVEIVAEGSDEPIVSTSVPQSDEIETTATFDLTDVNPPNGLYLLRVRAVRGGDDATDWTACPFEYTGFVEPDGGGDEGNEDDGCGCATGGGAPTGLLFVLGLGILRLRSRRRK